MCRDRTVQTTLWEMTSDLWDDLPEETRIQCRKLLTRLLADTIHAELREGKGNHERED